MKTGSKSSRRGARRKGIAGGPRLADGDSSSGLLKPVASVKGVGPKTAEALARRGVRVIEDLLYFIPVRYEDRRFVRPIEAVAEGDQTVVSGRVVDSGKAYSRASRRKLCYARIDDGTGWMTLKWFRFNKGMITGLCKKGNVLLASGKAVRYGAELQIVHPKVTVVGQDEDASSLGSVIPVYPEVEGVKPGVLEKIMREAIEAVKEDIVSVIPKSLSVSYNLPDLKYAFMTSHFPDGAAPCDPFKEEGAARIVLEEFFLFQIALLLKKGQDKAGRGIGLRPGKYYRHLLKSLPFELTPGQERARGEIERDLKSFEPMNRLLQGDVGCGKTVCAALAAAIALDNGCQAVFMAPTEILAEQHYLSIHKMLEGIGIEPVLVRGNMGGERDRLLCRIVTGEAKVVIGTHALLQPDVLFYRLGLAVIDEQHRFGVIQRSLLKDKGPASNVLVMSATPIPRTLSMVVYGDLDSSLIDDIPPGRQRVRTEVVDESRRQRVYDAILAETGKGHQTFIVYPTIAESEAWGSPGAKESLLEWRRLFPSLRIGLLHGAMRVEEKEAVMVAFRNGEMDLLVCTTVVEVGIDVPNATLMVVEHGERFGLSQLHQLRGRVGRGQDEAFCIVVSSSKKSEAAAARLRVLVETTDGFVIAEEDMKLRGPGDMIGVRQAGIPLFRIGSIVRHGHIMSRARNLAGEALAGADAEELAELEAAASRKWGERRFLGEVL